MYAAQPWYAVTGAVLSAERKQRSRVYAVTVASEVAECMQRKSLRYADTVAI